MIYHNLDPEPRISDLDLARWRVARVRRPAPPPGLTVPPPVVANDGTALHRGDHTVTWIGHASVVVQLDGATILCDPVWSAMLLGGFRRLTPPGLPLAAVPAPDVVLLSHNHYDHLDLPTLWRLGRSVPIWAPSGLGSFLRWRGFRYVREFDWWDGATLGDLRITAVPAQHWSRRYAWDINRSWWCGWMIEGSRRLYFAGDTAFFSGFGQIARRFPDLDVAILPIGAYDPPELLRSVHMSPEEAGAAWAILGAKRLLPMHYGTFQLSDEPIGEPPERMRAWWKKYTLPPERLIMPKVGQTIRI